MDFIANATGAIYAQSWTPEVQKLFAGQEIAAKRALEGAVGLRAAGEERRLVQDQSLHAARGDGVGPARTERRARSSNVADPPGEGPRRAPAGLAVRRSSACRVCASSCSGRSFRRSSTRSTSGTASLPARWVGLANFKTVFTDHDLLGVLGHAFQLIIFFSGIPVAARACRRDRDATGRLAADQRRRACRALPAAGRAARRGRDRVELGAVVHRRRQPGAQGGRPRRRHACLARRLRDGAAGRRRDRRLGAARPLHGPAPRGHVEDRPDACTRPRSSTAPGRSASSSRSRCRACGRRSASASP